MRNLSLSLLVCVVLFTVPAWAFASSDGTVKAGGAKVYSGKSTSSKELVSLKGGAEVVVLVTQGEWTRIKTSEGKVGWVETGAIEVGGDEGGDDLGLDGVEVASVERNETGGAIRGRPGVNQGLGIVILVAGYDAETAAKLEAQVAEQLPKARIVARVIKADAPPHGPVGPAGGAQTGRSLARALGANAVIAIAPSKAGPKGTAHVRYEIVDGGKAKVVATGNQGGDLDAALKAIAGMAKKLE